LMDNIKSTSNEVCNSKNKKGHKLYKLQHTLIVIPPRHITKLEIKTQKI